MEHQRLSEIAHKLGSFLENGESLLTTVASSIDGMVITESDVVLRYKYLYLSLRFTPLSLRLH